MPRRPLSRRRFVHLAAATVAAAGGLPFASTARARRRKDRPRHFVLVHGAWHGAWCWYKIVAGLEAAGHQVTALDLPAAGIDGSAPAAVTLQAQADRVVATLDAAAEPVVLVGHSAGGAPISVAAEARPDRIEKLVYLTAFLLPSGSSIVSVALDDEGSLLPSHLAVTPDGTIDVARDGRRDIFYGDCDDRDVALAQTLLRPIGLRTNIDPVVVGGNFARVRRFYVSCLQDYAISPTTQRAMYTALPCEKVFALRSDHSPFLSHPTALLRVLGAIARA
jgi:pimeloyl-ACP methyl ester carboxylesterase